MIPLKLLMAAPLLLPVAAERHIAGCNAHKPFKTEIEIKPCQNVGDFKLPLKY